ncbi:unnamed protein product [Lathyrus sativus]|nr:unnamed protein product [Lathyrus sativus]
MHLHNDMLLHNLQHHATTRPYPARKATPTTIQNSAQNNQQILAIESNVTQKQDKYKSLVIVLRRGQTKGRKKLSARKLRSKISITSHHVNPLQNHISLKFTTTIRRESFSLW